MIKISLNGKEISLKNDMNVADFLRLYGFDFRFIALERDKQILPKSSWESEMISSGKSYEVVKFVGGG